LAFYKRQSLIAEIRKRSKNLKEIIKSNICFQ